MFLRQIRFYGSKSKKQSVVDEYLRRQSSDYYSRLAKEHNYRARSAFKLLAINEKHKVINPGDVVVDIGAAPGSWSQVAAELVFGEGSQGIVTGRPSESRKGYVLGVDIQPISSLPNIDFIGQGDITRRSTHERIQKKLAGRLVNAIISDMAPNPTGDHYTDHLRIIELCRLLFRLAFIQDDSDCPPVLPLAADGRFLCKVFDGKLTTDFAAELGTKFKSVQIVKPLASRETSSEKYLLAKGIR
uniref:rRNA methyltransferase 2, mitochondrial n=1 Tax=Panagrellus redivivus TaxID=6233 RepID=A0A7E4UPF7_PANRE